VDTIQPLQALIPERPLLGVWVLVTCLAGGAATQNLAVVPHTVDRIDYAFGDAAKLPVIPAVALAGNPAPSALVAPPKFRQFRSFDQTVPAQTEAEFVAPLQSAQAAARNAAAVLPLSEPVAAPLAAAAIKPALALSEAAPTAVPQTEAIAEPALATPRVAASFDSAFESLGTPGAEVAGADPAPVTALAAPTIANPPGLRGFDLARVVPSAARKPTALIAPRAAAKPSTSSAPKPRSASTRDRILDATVFHPTTIMIGGQNAGQVDVRIGADMKPSIKVGDLLGMVSAQMDPELAAQLSAASGAADYVSFAMLRDAGFKVSYNAGADSVSIGVAD